MGTAGDGGIPMKWKKDQHGRYTWRSWAVVPEWAPVAGNGVPTRTGYQVYYFDGREGWQLEGRARTVTQGKALAEAVEYHTEVEVSNPNFLDVDAALRRRRGKGVRP